MRQHLHALRQPLALLLIGILALGMLGVSPAHAGLTTSIIVKTSLGDAVNTGDGCTLREALQRLFSAVADCGGAQASGAVFITFDTPGTIKLTQGQLPNITSGNIVTVTGPVIIDGNSDNIFIVKTDGVLNLAALTLTKGARAISVDSGTLNVAGTSFLGNSQDSAGGAINSSGSSAMVNIAGSLFTANKAPNGSGGAIYATSGSLNIAGTIFTGNVAKINGGAIYSTVKTSLIDTIFNGNIGSGDDGADDFNAGGGAVYFGTGALDKPLTVTRGIFNGNLSPMGDGGAIFVGIDSPAEISDSALNGNLAGIPTKPRAGGALFNTSPMSVTHSTFLNNGVVGNGGAIANDRRGKLIISNSTFVANAATFDPVADPSNPTGNLGLGGGIATLNSQTGSPIRPTTRLLNVSLAFNASVGGTGGGLYSQDLGGSPEVTTLGNTIISGSDGAGGNCGGGPFTSLGHNLDSGTSCGLTGAGNLQNADAKLGPPFFSGGPISTLLTMKLKPGSAAIDAGDNAICAAAPVSNEDERGAARPQDGDGTPPSACDIGAYEGDPVFPGFGSTPVDPGPVLFGNATIGTSLPGSLSVFNTGDATLTISGGSISGPAAGDFALTSTFPISIAPGGPSQTISLSCAPSATGQRSAALILSTNDPTKASVGFNLVCTGTPTPTAGFSSTPTKPGPINIGKVQIGQSGSATLKIAEVGAATLDVTNLTLGGLNPGDFKLDSMANISIGDGGAIVSRLVTCTPTALGQRSATLTMQTNDPSQPSASFSLSCTGKPAPQLVFEGTGTPVATVSGPYGVTLDPQGKQVYVSNDGTGSVIRYLRDASGYPTSGLGYADGLSGGPSMAGSMRNLVSPDGKFLYVSAGSDNAINTFARNPSDGTLTSPPETVKFGDPYKFLFCPCPTIQGLNGAYAMALSPDGKYMYVSGINSNSITVLARDPDTGSLKDTLSTRPAVAQEYLSSVNLPQAYDLAMSPDGQYLYAAAYGTSLNGYNDSRLTVFKRNPNDGTITVVTGGIYTVAAVPSLKGVFRVTLSPDGNFVYATSYNSNAVTAFQRDPSTGKLTAISGGVYGDGVSSHAMTSAAVSPDGRYLFATEFASPGSVLIYQRDQGTGELDLLQTITTADIAGARDVAVAPDGRMIFVTGHSSGKVVGFAIANPVPVLISLDPASVVAGSPQITLTIHGEGFAPGAVATWGGVDLAGTQFISANELQVPLPANLLGTASTVQVGARNPGPAGGNSANTLPFKITAPATPTTPAENPVPSITMIVPNSTLVGSPSQQVTVTGAGFILDSKVLWNGDERPTLYVNGTTLLVTISEDDLLQPGTSGVAVRNPEPGGGVSNVLGFDVVAPGENPSPSITSISPKSAIAGSVSTELLVTINGLNFMPESQARWEGNARPTTYISPTQLQVAVSGGDLLNVGVYSIDVVNPAPGGGTSNSAIFRVGATGSNPVPSVTGMSLAFINGGVAGMEVTLTGQGFVSGATVLWSGVEYTTVSVNATMIVFQVPPSAMRSATVLVKNPAPGGGTSDILFVEIPRVALPLIRR